MIFLNLDDNGYLASYFTNDSVTDNLLEDSPLYGLPHVDDLNDYDLSGNRFRAHYWDGESLVFDNNRFLELEAETNAMEKYNVIAGLKEKLSETDYVIIKIMEGVATVDEYKDIIAQRQKWREQINELGG